jgi:hypothetical protein
MLDYRTQEAVSTAEFFSNLFDGKAGAYFAEQAQAIKDGTIEREPFAKKAAHEDKAKSNSAGGPGSKSYGPQFKLTRLGDIKLRPAEFVVDSLLETRSLAMMFGPPSCGKSFIAVDVAASVASGLDFHGRKTLQGPVLYLAGEGHSGLKKRFAAWAKARGASLEDAPLFLSHRAPMLLDKNHARAVTKAVDAVAKAHGTPRLIIVDTVARALGGGDENSSQDVGQFVRGIDDLRSGHPGCTVLLVHHSGHQSRDRARGSSALKAALDAEYAVSKSGRSVTVNCSKMKDAQEPPELAFNIGQIDLGDGMESACLSYADPDDIPREKPLTPGQKIAMEAFVTAAVTLGGFFEGKFTGLHIEQWRNEFYRVHHGENVETKRKAFNRARQDLVQARKISADDDIYRPTDEGIIGQIEVDAMFKRDTGQ